MRDAAALRGEGRATFNGWTGNRPDARLDYVWLSRDLEKNLRDYRVIETRYRRKDGSMGFPSDHFAVSVEFGL